MNELRPKVGFAGLGAMGGGMARHLASSGFDVLVHDPSRKAVERAVDAGCVAAGSISALGAGRDVVVLMLPHPDVTRQVVMGPGGLASTLEAGAVIIDCATDGPDVVKELEVPLRARGISIIDSPVGRGVEFAARGELLLMVGGEDSVVKRALPVLEALSTEIVRCGALGAGQVVKLANNLVSIANVAVIAEAVALARREQVAPELLATVLARTAADSWQLRNVLERRLPTEDFSLGFKTGLALKDLQLFDQLAAERDLRMPMAAGAIEWYRRACDSGFGDMDQCAIATVDAEKRADSAA